MFKTADGLVEFVYEKQDAVRLHTAEPRVERSPVLREAGLKLSVLKDQKL